MRVALVTVGAELLVGTVVNHNAAWLSHVLTGAGMQVTRHAVVSDDESEIVEAVSAELGRAEAAIVTGGLGPTSDDRTRAALARLAGVPLKREDALVARLHDWYERRGRVAPPTALVQADVPEGASVLSNPRGSAPGLRLELPSGVVYALPGVPAEMRAMVEAEVLPDLLEQADTAPPPARTLLTAVIGESLVASLLRPLEREAEARGVEVAYLASVGEVRVRFSGGPGRAAGADVDAVAERARMLLGDVVYGEGDDTLDVVVHRRLAAAGATVAVAESLTGGLLGGALTDMPGSSDTYRGGVTAYATDVKASLLGVDRVLLEREGPVHAEVAHQMAAGVRREMGASVGLATTGVAGPDPQATPGGSLLPPGTVHLAVDGPGVDLVVSERLGGDRDVVRRRVVVWALDLLRRGLSGMPPYRDPESLL